MSTTTTHEDDTLAHLGNGHISSLALSIDEDTYGANGDFSNREIKARLIDRIHAETDYQYSQTGLMPISQTADLLLSLWRHEDRHQAELAIKLTAGDLLLSRSPPPVSAAKPPQVRVGDLRCACGRKVQPFDVQVGDAGRVLIVCSSCHRDVLSIGFRAD